MEDSSKPAHGTHCVVATATTQGAFTCVPDARSAVTPCRGRPAGGGVLPWTSAARSRRLQTRAVRTRKPHKRFSPRRHGILLQRPLAKSLAFDAIMRGHVFSWCHRGDAVCQGGHLLKRTGIKGNTDYGDDETDLRTAALAARLAPIARRPPIFEHRVAGTCMDGECALSRWTGRGTTAFKAVGAT